MSEAGYDVLRAIRRILRQVSAHSQRLSRDHGVTVPQLLCIKSIGELAGSADDLTLARLSDRVQLSSATVSRIVERLVRAGLVVRQRSEHDRRRVCLSLSDAGQARYEALPMPLQERFVQRLLALPDGERQELLDALERVVSLMDAEDLDAAPVLSADVALPTGDG